MPVVDSTTGTTSGSTSSLTLVDVLQATPCLLKACEFEATRRHDGQYRSDVKSLRLVCKHARQAGLQAVTGCCLKLSTEASIQHQILQMAQLMFNVPLQRLRVDVAVAPLADGTESAQKLPSSVWRRFLHVLSCCNTTPQHPQPLPFAASSCPAPHSILSSQHELSLHTSLLSEFLSTVGTALAGLASLELTFQVEETPRTRQLWPQWPRESVSSAARSHTISDAAGAAIASVLAGACPRLMHLGISGGAGIAVLRVFGARCPRLNSLELIDNQLPGAVLHSVIEQKLLPHLTHVTLEAEVSTRSEGTCVNKLLLVAAVGACSTLTHLRIGGQPLQSGFQWLALLPSSLQQLSCHRLPVLGVPENLPLANLKRLEIRESITGFGASQLLSLLPAAPLLQFMSLLCDEDETGAATKEGRVLTLKPCTANAIRGLRLLHQRMQAGLVLGNIHVTSTTISEQFNAARVELIPVHTILESLDVFAGFNSCFLEDGGVHPPDPASDRAASNSLKEVNRLLPELITLTFRGFWREANVLQLMGGRALTHIFWEATHGVAKATLVQMIVRMPWLRLLQHKARDVCTTTQNLQMMLRAARRDVLTPAVEVGDHDHSIGMSNGGIGSSCEVGAHAAASADACGGADSGGADCRGGGGVVGGADVIEVLPIVGADVLEEASRWMVAYTTHNTHIICERWCRLSCAVSCGTAPGTLAV